MKLKITKILMITLISIIISLSMVSAENWEQVDQTNDYISFVDKDSTTSYIQGNDTIVIVNAKLIIPALGATAYTTIEYKIYPLQYTQVGNNPKFLETPKVKESRERYLQYLNAKGQVMKEESFPASKAWTPFQGDVMPHFLMPWYLKELEKDILLNPTNYKS